MMNSAISTRDNLDDYYIGLFCSLFFTDFPQFFNSDRGFNTGKFFYEDPMDVVFDKYFKLLNKDIRILPLKSNYG